tara:strand:+ start:20 stop:679 length:660 start_codon:yes stop_codon:yes gene_type:complete
MARRQKKYHYIYKTTCSVNKKYYIGMHSTDKMDDGYLGSGKRLWNSIKYHGKENFTKEILEYCETREELKKREEEIVNEQLLTEDLCLNLKVGGEGGGRIWNEEHMKVFSKSGNDAFKSKMEDPNYRENHSKKMSESRKKDYENGKRERTYFYDWYGKNHSEETKKILSKQRKGVYGLGENNSVYGRKWMNKDGVKKMVKKEEIEEHTNTGWLFGKMKK